MSDFAEFARLYPDIEMEILSSGEARMGNAGRREFIQVLRLMEDFQQCQVEQAVIQALSLGAIASMR